MMTSWWNQNTEKKMGNNHTYENSHTGPSLMIPPLGYLHQEIGMILNHNVFLVFKKIPYMTFKIRSQSK